MKALLALLVPIIIVPVIYCSYQLTEGVHKYFIKKMVKQECLIVELAKEVENEG